MKNTNNTATPILTIAEICHQTNKAWCELHADRSQKDWQDAAEWQRKSAILGVQLRLQNPDAGDSAQHDAWMEVRLKEGWSFGKEKDANKKTHPCIIPFEELPEFQQKKDALFCAIVDALK